MARPDLPDPRGADDVLAQPTRRRLFTLLSELGGAVATDELARRLDLHPNGVRTQLRRLLDAGLVTHRRVRQGRGRPRDEWAVAPGARPGGAEPRAYGTLARWLARAIPATPSRLRELEAAGRDIGKELSADLAGDGAAQAVGDVMAALGFQPEIALEPGGRLHARLCNCPYRDSVRENRDVVCTLHRGITLGVLDRVAPGARLVRFVPHDPDTAGCEVDIHGLVR